VHDAVSQNHAIGADHFGDGQGRGDLHHRDAGFFQLGCNRSAAASARASGGGENDGVDAFLLDLLHQFPSQTARVR
jgi:hypothetical protein